MQAQINQLLDQLAKQQGGTTTPPTYSTSTWCHTFNVNLGVGSSGDEVGYLQIALRKENLYPTQGNPSFDELIASAVVQFQQKYKSEILTPVGLQYGTGYVGNSTRVKLNKLYGCGNDKPKACTMDVKQCPDGSYVGRSGPNCGFDPCLSLPIYIVKDTYSLLRASSFIKKESNIPLIFYVPGRENEIVNLIKAFKSVPLVKLIYFEDSSFVALENEFGINNISFNKQSIESLTIGGYELISFSDEEELKPYAAVFAGKNKGLFLDSLADISKYINQISSKKIIYFGSNPQTLAQIKIYSADVIQVPTLRESEIKLATTNSSTKIVTVIPKISSNYSRLGVLYAIYRDSALISVTGNADDVFSFDDNINTQLNLIKPSNNNQEYKYMVIVGDWFEIPYRYKMPFDVFGMNFSFKFSADSMYADRNSYWSKSDIADEDKFFIPDMGVGRILGYDLTSASILLNIGYLYENDFLTRSDKAVFSSDWNIGEGFMNDTHSIIISSLTEMYGTENFYAAGDPGDNTVDGSLIANNQPREKILNLSKDSDFILFEGHGTPNYLSATNPVIDGQAILEKRPYKPALWYLNACNTIVYSGYTNYSGAYTNLDSALRSLATNVFGSIDVVGGVSSWGSWYLPHFKQGYPIGDVLRLGLQDASNSPYNASNYYEKYSLNIQSSISQYQIVGDPLIRYGKINRTPQEVICTDSDNGKDYYTKGTMISGGVSFTDYCVTGSPNQLNEYSCNGNIVHTCPSSCINGACAVSMSVQKTVSVVSPNGGEKWEVGKTYEIQWKTTGEIASDSKFNITLIYEPFKAVAIANGVSITNNSYAWNIAPRFLAVNSSIFKVIISVANSKESYQDESDNYFTISKDYIASETFTWNLEKGNHLISFPIKPVSDKIIDIFKPIEGKIFGTLLWWSEINGKWRSLTTTSSVTIDPNRSYLINMKEPAVLTIQGTKWNKTFAEWISSLNIVNGWNSIGYPFLEQKSIKDFNPSHPFQNIQTYSSSQNKVITVYNKLDSINYSPEVFEAGRGYYGSFYDCSIATFANVCKQLQCVSGYAPKCNSDGSNATYLKGECYCAENEIASSTSSFLPLNVENSLANISSQIDAIVARIKELLGTR